MTKTYYYCDCCGNQVISSADLTELVLPVVDANSTIVLDGKGIAGFYTKKFEVCRRCAISLRNFTASLAEPSKD